MWPSGSCVGSEGPYALAQGRYRHQWPRPSEIKAGKIEYRLDKTNIIHCPIGKVSFGTEKLRDNFHTLMDAVVKAKPSAAKGQYLRSVTVTSTMGPGVKINGQKVLD